MPKYHNIFRASKTFDWLGLHQILKRIEDLWYIADTPINPSIEPIIGHLKSDHRLKRNYLKGIIGDANNLMLAAVAFSLKKQMREDPHS